MVSVATREHGPLDHTSISNSDMHQNWDADDDLSDDWFDNADDIMDRGKREFLQKCFDLPCYRLNTEKD